MTCFSYVLARDYGFAPNPFGPYCTLATCKPGIRNSANIGDWVVGTGSVRHHGSEKLIFAMKVREKLSFNMYWNDTRLLYKRPILNGSLKQMYGDNIYFEAEGQWHQADSHHSNDDGTVNTYNLKRDTSCRFVLVSEHFFYFGSKAVRIPEEFLAQDGECICKKGPGYRWRFADNFVLSFIEWLEGNHKPGYQSNPELMTSFERYDGIS